MIFVAYLLHNLILTLEVNMKNQVQKILEKLKVQNDNYKIKIRYRKNPSGNYRLYLDYWNREKRQTNNLKLYISNKKKDIRRNKNVIQKALAIRNKKELQLLESNTGIRFSNSSITTNFIDFFKEFYTTKSDTNYRIAYDYFVKFYNKEVLDIKKLDYELSEKFMNYLLSFNIANYTAQHYFAAYKACLNYAVKLGKIDFNPAQTLRIKYQRTKIERLTFKEMQKLEKTECKYNDLKNGFLFACYTGLRISDIRKLKDSNIQKDHIKIIQQKTKTETDTKLNETAKLLLEEQRKKKKDEYIFHIPHGGKTSKRLSEWILNAGIKKKITFHCARHTFGCLLIENGVDVFTVKKLMGHKDIRTTLQYVEKVDKTKDKAIDKLPKLK